MEIKPDAIPLSPCETERAKRLGNKTRRFPKKLITCQSTR